MIQKNLSRNQMLPMLTAHPGDGPWQGKICRVCLHPLLDASGKVSFRHGFKHVGRSLAGILLGLQFLACESPGADRILCIQQNPQTVEGTYDVAVYGFLTTMDHVFSPKHLAEAGFEVDTVRWHEARDKLKQVQDYRAVIIWEAPYQVRFKAAAECQDIFYSDLDVFPSEVEQQLISYVEKGGALLMAGGVSCYGDGEGWPKGWSADQASPKEPSGRQYKGYASGALTRILPVIIPVGSTLRPFPTGHTNEPLRVAAPSADPVTTGLDFQEWSFGAYHKLTANKGAEILLASASGDPLLVRWTIGKGRVVALTASPKGSAFFPQAKGFKPFWSGEAALWNRLVRWALKAEPVDAAAERRLQSAYEERSGAPPNVPTEWVRAKFPYGVQMGCPAWPSLSRQQFFRYFSDHAINTIVSWAEGLTPGWMQAFSYEMAANNMVGYLHPAVAGAANWAFSNAKGSISTNAFASISQPGGVVVPHYGQPFPDPMSPFTRKHAAEQAQRILFSVQTNAEAIAGAFYDDEYQWGGMGWRHAYEGNPGRGGYGDGALAYYKALTGEDAPMPPTNAAPGWIMPENHPWLRWIQAIQQDTFADFNRQMRSIFKSGRPDWILSSYPGGFDGELDVMVEELYQDCRSNSAFDAFAIFDSRANFREDYTGRRYPIWALIGIFQVIGVEDKASFPESLRLQIGCSLGHGAKGIILWNGVNLYLAHHQHAGYDTLMEEAARWGVHLEQYGPMYLALNKTRNTVWCTAGWFWQDSWENLFFLPKAPGPDGVVDKEWTWFPIQIGEVVNAALARSNLQLNFVTEKQLLSPDLFRQKAVIIPGLQYCREKVVKNLEEYAARGGLLFTDESAAVRIRGAKTLPVDFSKWHRDIVAGKRKWSQPCTVNFWANYDLREKYVAEAIAVIRREITPQIKSEIEIDDTWGASSVLVNGDTRYLFIYNGDIRKPHTLQVTVRWPAGHAYDVLGGGGFAFNPDRALKAELPPGGWKLYAVSPDRITGLRAVAKQEDRRMRVTGNVCATDQRVWRGAAPVRISLLLADGRRIDRYSSSDDGLIRDEFSLDPGWPAVHRLILEELFSGKRTEVKLP